MKFLTNKSFNTVKDLIISDAGISISEMASGVAMGLVTNTSNNPNYSQVTLFWLFDASFGYFVIFALLAWNPNVVVG